MITPSRPEPAHRRRKTSHGGQALSGFHNPGGLEAFVHRPDALSAGAALVVALHGCTQSGPAYARDAGWIELADREGFVVLAPSQVRANNPNLCFNWYGDAHAGVDGLEIRSLLAMIEAAIEAHDLDRRKVFVTGLSAGAAMAFALICHHPQVFAGAGIIAGLPAGQARTLGEALAMMKGRHEAKADGASSVVSLAPGQGPALSVWHGTADQIVVPSNADAICAQWSDLTGLPATPSRTERSGKLSRSVWTQADGSVAMELNRLSGFGHATPLDTAGPEGIGRSAPHMVDCGVSSTLQLARCWGIATRGQTARGGERTERTLDRTGDAPTSGVPPLDVVHPGLGGLVPGLRTDIMAGLQDRVPAGVRDLIDRSLRQAGL